MEPRKPLNKLPLRIFSPEGIAQPANADGKSRVERELDQVTGVNEPATVAVSLGKIVPLLMDAAERNRLWLTDFSEETVRIDADLYEVLLAYERLRQQDAA